MRCLHGSEQEPASWGRQVGIENRRKRGGSDASWQMPRDRQGWSERATAIVLLGRGREGPENTTETHLPYRTLRCEWMMRLASSGVSSSRLGLSCVSDIGKWRCRQCAIDARLREPRIRYGRVSLGWRLRRGPLGFRLTEGGKWPSRAGAAAVGPPNRFGWSRSWPQK